MTSIHLLLFSLLFLLPLLAFAQNKNNISTGSSLLANDEASSWSSPSGDFAFGFCQLDNKAFFLLCIRFDKIPEKTIVWYANGDKPAQRGSKVELTANGGLVLTDPEGNEIWSSQPSNTVAYGAMLDTGNFVLASGNSTNLWESFKNPTDTMLPTQVLQRDGALYSRQSENNFTRGRFQLLFYQDGSLQLNALQSGLSYVTYYNNYTHDDPGYQLVFNESSYMYIERMSGKRVDLTRARVVLERDFYYRATIIYDGVFTLYSHPKPSNGNESWSPVWSIPNNICIDIRTGYGPPTCGYNSICKLNSNKRPSCDCPKGYSIVDPNDSFSGCKPDFTLCGEHGAVVIGELYQITTLNNVDWPDSTFKWVTASNEDECGKSCLNDCFCAAAFFRDKDCYMHGLPLKNGRVDPTLNGKVLVKVAKFGSPTRDLAHPIAGRKKLIGSVLLGSSFFFNIVLVGTIIVLIFFMRNCYKKLTRPNRDKKDWEMYLPSFTYKDLEEATDGFKEELGRGSFGIVYKGVLENKSTCFVAVKKLDKMIQKGEKEFKAEVNVIGHIHHKNLVRLLGFCEEEEQRLLVYEFMSNGALASFLFNETRLNWDQRIQIAFGIARGILYLHEECCSQIIHCDLKPQNILLDDNYVPKISDFGLAKALLINQSKTHTDIRGTKGYVAPEWFKNKPITVKVDVYSFGVILLEIICCRRSVDEQFGEEKAILTDWAYDSYKAGQMDAIVDNDEEAINDMILLKRLVMIAIWCIQEDPSRRPTMREVVQMIEGVIEVTAPP